MLITRRHWLAFSAFGAALPFAQPVRITVDTNRTLGLIPPDFLGLGYEISSVSTPGLLSPKNHSYVQLVRHLAPAGVIRIGGITADYASFSPNAQPVSSPKGSIVNLANLRELAGFLQATRWKLIWCLNLGTGTVQQAVLEAQAVAAAVQTNLLAFEIGNEPDLFNRGASSHRPPTYSYADYLQEYRRYKTAIRAQLPTAPFAAPDAAATTGWVTNFASDEGRDLALLTHHYYRECAGPTSTLDKLLHSDPKLDPLLAKLKAAADSSHVPYRLCETNSFCGGGKPGVSDTFGAALWVLDFLWKLASFGCAGVNIETGVNQLDFVSSYSPIADNTAKPEYYGMLAFAHAAGAAQVPLTLEAAGLNLTAYAAQRGRTISITIINKDASQSADVLLTSNLHPRSTQALRLRAPSLESKTGVTFAPSKVNATGPIHVAAASAIVLHLVS